MQLATFDSGRLGVVVGDAICDVTDVAHPAGAGAGLSAMRRVIADWAVFEPKIRAAADSGPRKPLSAVVLDPPVPDPSKVVAAPVNYVDHMQEMSEDFHISSLGVFLKAPSSLIGSDARISLPYTDRRFDQEGELAVVIGRRSRNVSGDEALANVFGYTGCLDITMRGGEDRSTRKSFDTFTPLGPWIVTADEFGSSDSVALECAVNGVVRQRANTADLIWGVAALVAYASSVMTLEPGDVISTGTPAGVGQIFSGDEIELQLSGLGPLRAAVTDEFATLCPTQGSGHGPVPPAAVTFPAPAT